MKTQAFTLTITLSFAFAIPVFAFQTTDALHPLTYKTDEQVWRMQIEIAAESRQEPAMAELLTRVVSRNDNPTIVAG